MAAPLLLVSGVMHTALAAEATIFRYVDRNGQTVFDSRIPPEYARNGYTILNQRGQVVQVVPPAPSAAELAARALAEEQQRLQEEAERAQREADNLLLRLYRAPDDIARKRDDRLAQLETQRNTSQVSLNKAESEIERLQGVIGNFGSQGREVPPETLSLLRVQESEKERLSAHMLRLEEDMQTATAEADRDIKRLSELLGLPVDAGTEQ